ncbi:MAG: HAD-IIIA family hydrolase [Spirochaetales bacterium]|nr:HAD-IIIA family hydrolase [Spirochaetales bacterium]
MSFHVFLDRDGVINADSPDYIKSPEEFHFIPGSPEAVALLTDHGFEVILITNQSLIGRGMAPVATLEAIFAKMRLGIAEAVDEATDGTVVLGPGTLYRSLKEMLRDGLIEAAAAPSPDDDPRRRYYALTEEGRTAVQDEAARMARIVDVARENRVLPEVP